MEVTRAAPAAGPEPPLYYDIACPHCGGPVQVPRDGINCQIFRHGVYKTNPGLAIPPHAPKAECDRLVAEGLIYGCGRPFRFDGATVAVCDYV